MYLSMNAYSPWVLVYFLPVVCVVGFFVFNLFLAVVYDEFKRGAEEEERKTAEQSEEDREAAEATNHPRSPSHTRSHEITRDHTRSHELIRDHPVGDDRLGRAAPRTGRGRSLAGAVPYQTRYTKPNEMK